MRHGAIGVIGCNRAKTTRHKPRLLAAQNQQLRIDHEFIEGRGIAASDRIFEPSKKCTQRDTIVLHHTPDVTEFKCRFL